MYIYGLANIFIVLEQNKTNNSTIWQAFKTLPLKIKTAFSIYFAGTISLLSFLLAAQNHRWAYIGAGVAFVIIIVSAFFLSPNSADIKNVENSIKRRKELYSKAHQILADVTLQKKIKSSNCIIA